MSQVQIASRLTLASGYVVNNRIAKAALTECIADPSSNTVNERHINLYKRWGETKAGLIMTGNIMVDRRYLEAPPNVVVDDLRDLETLKALAKGAQANGSLLVAQLSHPGRQCARSITWNPVAPSEGDAVKMIIPLFSKPRAMTKDEIHQTVQMFARTAAICKTAGLSGVQIHAAHGYLISQFLSPLTNKRTDEYGGPIENRQRFLIEIIRAVRKEVGNNFIVAVKMNSADFMRGGFNEEDAMFVVKSLDEEKIDFLEISGGTYENFVPLSKQQSTIQREAHFIEFAKKVKQTKSPKLPLMITGGFRSREFMNKCLAEGSVDIIGLGRPFCVESIASLRGLIDGSTSMLTDVNLDIGQKDFDSGVQNMWHQLQISRIADGLEPDLNMTTFWAATLLPVRRYVWEPMRAPWITAAIVAVVLGIICTIIQSAL